MYSKQDLEKLNGNLKKIEEFCRQNYIPRIPRREDRICVDFGPLESYPRQWGREPKYSFGMDGRGNIWFGVGLALYCLSVRTSSLTSSKTMFMVRTCF